LGCGGSAPLDKGSAAKEAAVPAHGPKVDRSRRGSDAFTFELLAHRTKRDVL